MGGRQILARTAEVVGIRSHPPIFPSLGLSYSIVSRLGDLFDRYPNMLGFCKTTRFKLQGARFWDRQVIFRLSSTKASDPLRILFCGSDDFSNASLRILHNLQQVEPGLIKSIDVLCRPPKPTGRGLKAYREVPISLTARQLGLPIHHRDTFRGWSLPRYDATPNSNVDDDGRINLIIAVSFGLLIPSRIINYAKYGGLNIHPSLLPDFRGAAPIEHTLLAGDSRTGVTLQTLHPTKMDHGQILLQWPALGLEIPNPLSIRPVELVELLAPLGAKMLVHGIRHGLYIPPIQDLTPKTIKEEHEKLRIAPKIQPEDRRIRWNEWSSEEIFLRHRVIGPLWNNIKLGGEDVRVTFSQGFSASSKEAPSLEVPPGLLMCSIGKSTEPGALWCKTKDDKLLQVDSIKVSGYGNQKASTWARKVKLFESNNPNRYERFSQAGFTLASSSLD